MPWFLGTSSVLIILVQLFNNLGDSLKNTSETLTVKLDALEETNRLIARNILKATQMQIESSQNSNNELEKIGTEITDTLEKITVGVTKLELLERIGSEMTLLTNEIMKFKEVNEESSQKSNNALENLINEIREGSQQVKVSLDNITPTLDSNLDSIQGAIMAVEEEIDDGNVNNEVQKIALNNIASKIELLNSDGLKNLMTGLATVENKIEVGLSKLGSMSEESLEVLANEIRKAFINNFFITRRSILGSIFHTK